MRRGLPRGVSACLLRIWGYDTRFFGLISALMALHWAVWLLVAGADELLFQPQQIYWVLRSIFSHALLIFLFAFYALTHILGIYCDWGWLRRAALLLGTWLWSTVAYSIYLSGLFYPTTGIYATLALGCAWSYIKVREGSG